MAPLPPALSSLSLPVMLPLASVEAALEQLLGPELVRLDESLQVLGGLATLQVSGTIGRAGPLTLAAGAPGWLEVTVPLRADLQLAARSPGRLSQRAAERLARA
ncbi:hypothetical protein ACFP81_07855 [Deinococcus lacus]|uniref:DUF2993 domain-containing protein n=1 Tax=Deinococcus lacus TaxID=392561 RepID=A0ABW1YEI9_9DEIO